MPPRRKAAQSARNAQPKLSFNSKPSKITKPHSQEPSLGKKEIKAEVLIPEITEIEQPKPAPSKPKDESTLRAERISDKQIQQYWQKEEDVRRAPRGKSPSFSHPPRPDSRHADKTTVHQEGLSVHEKILRHFDLCSQYGPCIGIVRLKRWKRAETLGLKPPVEVLAVMLKEEAVAEKENEKWAGERAHLDELMNPNL